MYSEAMKQARRINRMKNTGHETLRQDHIWKGQRQTRK